MLKDLSIMELLEAVHYITTSTCPISMLPNWKTFYGRWG
jgi:hypothetical protein